MSQLPELNVTMVRFKTACEFKQVIDHDKIVEAMSRWAKHVTDVPLTVRFVETEREIQRDARDAWDARAARVAWAARDAWDAWDARAAWDARVAWAARAAWDARVAWDARAARVARVAWDARAAWDNSWFAITAIGAIQTQDQKTFDTWICLLEALEAGAWLFFITTSELVVATIPSVISTDAERRLHAEHGPAFAWADVADYYWHGVHVDKHVIDAPETITVAEIEVADNAEVRRVLTERFGQERYLRESNAQLISEDRYGKLWRKDIFDDEPLVMVEVLNSTPEPDGSVKTYFLRVPPRTKTAHEAIAWTFGMTSAQYHPLFES